MKNEYTFIINEKKINELPQENKINVREPKEINLSSTYVTREGFPVIIEDIVKIKNGKTMKYPVKGYYMENVHGNEKPHPYIWTIEGKTTTLGDISPYDIFEVEKK